MRSLTAVALAVFAACTATPPSGGTGGGSAAGGGGGTACATGELACATGCVTVRADDANCGACGTVCAAGTQCADAVCRPSACAGVLCPGGQVCIDDQCVDASCVGVLCPSGQRCADGVCRPASCTNMTCTPDSVCENDACIETACVGISCPAGERCRAGACFGLGCFDGMRGGSETDVDCGGACSPCPVGNTCAQSADCASAMCTAMRCAPVAGCTDGKKDFTESDRDCGGPTCPACSPGSSCLANRDCQSQRCVAGVCTTGSCTDSLRNQQETDVDCGGPMCTTRCPDGQRCGAGTDCASGVCAASRCVAATCMDLVKDGTETDVDCGGSCPGCASGGSCLGAPDCTNGACVAGHCAVGTCTPPDGMRNAAETDVDCGGTKCPSCMAGQMCLVAGDCLSRRCQGNTCAPVSCTDGVKNGVETDIDCGGGGACPKCLVGNTCMNGTDCSSASCVAGHCAAPTCTDSTRNGSETDVDCGGTTCPQCGTGFRCTGTNDCASHHCVTMTCVAPTCADVTKNGAESDTDCGGPDCGGCTLGRTCSASTDCAQGNCDMDIKICTGSLYRFASWPMPDSKTNRCYIASGFGACPPMGDPYYGQDGSYLLNVPTYTPNGAGDVITDSVTNLVWQRGFTFVASGIAQFAYCDSLVAGGFTDWRVPSRIELISLLDFGKSSGQLIDNAAFPSNPSGPFDVWFSGGNTDLDTTQASYFSLGAGSGYSTSSFAGGPPGGGNIGSRCVRGGAAAQSSTAGLYTLTASTAIDTKTQLEWQRTTGGATMMWTDALMQCRTFVGDGGAPWRLPSVKELSTIVADFRPSGVAIDSTAFPGTQPARYWTSTPAPPNGAATAYVIDFANGTFSSSNLVNPFYVRCVR